MNKDELKNMIDSHVRSRSERVSLLKLIYAEVEKTEHTKQVATVEQVIRKLIESNNVCLAARADENLETENKFLKTLLPNYLSVVELKEKLEPLGLEKSGASIGQAIKFLKANGLSFLPEDVKKAINE